MGRFGVLRTLIVRSFVDSRATGDGSLGTFADMFRGLIESLGTLGTLATLGAFAYCNAGGIWDRTGLTGCLRGAQAPFYNPCSDLRSLSQGALLRAIARALTSKTSPKTPWFLVGNERMRAL